MNISEIQPSGVAACWRKRKCNEKNDEPEKSGTQNKIVKYNTSYYVRLAEEIPVAEYESDSSTYDSFHGRETDLCKDTSDTESSSTTDGESEISKMEVLEYEIATSSDSDIGFEDQSSSSGTDEIMIAAVAHAIYDDDETTCHESDFALFADTEDSDSASDDPEIGRADYWECVKCKNRQNNPLYRYCEKCYQIRKNLFPPRPKKNRKSRTSLKSKKNQYSQESIGKNGNDNTTLNGINKNSRSGKSSVKQTNSAGESGNTDDSDIEFNNIKKLNFLSKSPKLISKRRKKNGNNRRTSLSTFSNVMDCSSNRTLSQTSSSSFIVLVDETDSSSDKDNILVSDKNTSMQQETCSTKMNTNISSLTDSNETNSSLILNLDLTNNKTDLTNTNLTATSCNELSSQNRKRTCNSIDNKATDDEDESKRKKIKLDLNGEFKINNKLFKNVVENWSGNSDTDLYIVKPLPPNQLGLNSYTKDSGFSSCSSQDLSPVIVSQGYDNDKHELFGTTSSQDTICDELDDEHIKLIESQNTNLSQAETASDSSETNLSPSVHIIDGLIKKSFSVIENVKPSPIPKLNSESSININSQSQNSEGFFGLCIMCLSEPKNGVFVHNSCLHACCCYKCAIKVWSKNKRCPICNCKAKNVMKLFIH